MMEQNLETAIFNGAIFKKLKRLWKECGYSDEDIANRCDQFKNEIEEYIQHLIFREEKKKQEMVETLRSLLNEAEKLSKELEVNFHSALYDTYPLCEALEKIKRETTRLREKKSELEEEILEMVKKEAELCSYLEEPTEIKLQDSLPTREEIATFNARLQSLQERKAALFTVFQSKKSEIASCMRELESEPSEGFERKVMCDDDEKFKLSEENMRKLEDLKTCFWKKILERQKHVNDLWDTLRMLWIRLHEDTTYKGNFLSTNTGIGTSTVTVLEQEIRRCEIKRRENITLYIKTVREEIQEFWDKCCFGKRQRLKFLEFYSEGSSEVLLQRLEEQACKLHKFYHENRCLLELATDYKLLWEKFLLLEEKSHDKDRLFKNRGGELLKEEKERNHIQKELPKIENDLKKLVRKYEEQNNEKFLFYGEDINEKICGLWSKLKEGRQNYRSSWKKPSSAKENSGVKQRLDFESTASYKKRQLAGLPKAAELVPQRDCLKNVTRRRVLSPLPNRNETFIFGVREIEYAAYSLFEDGTKQETELPSSSTFKRDVFREINNTKPPSGLKTSKIPMKPPRKNIGMAFHVRRKSNEFNENQPNKKLRRSSLPDIDI